MEKKTFEQLKKGDCLYEVTDNGKIKIITISNVDEIHKSLITNISKYSIYGTYQSNDEIFILKNVPGDVTIWWSCDDLKNKIFINEVDVVGELHNMKEYYESVLKNINDSIKSICYCY